MSSHGRGDSCFAVAVDSRPASTAPTPKVLEPQGPRFLVDAMAGRLGRWLRLLGYDARTASDEPDRVLVDLAVAEGRILVTRDRGLVTELRPDDCVVLRSERTSDQLRQLFVELGLRRREPSFERCSVCNVEIEPVDRARIRGRVPERIHRRHSNFWRCTSCCRIYWHGSHVERLRTEISRVLRGLASP